MLYYQVESGEGIAGKYEEVSAVTTTLSSCMGIVFLNSTTREGGLYHYPALLLEKPYIQKTIISMYNKIKPQRILVTPAAPLLPNNPNYMPGSSQKDINNIIGFLDDLGQAEPEPQRVDRATANYWWNGEKICVNGDGPGDGIGTRNGLAVFENIYDCYPRKISGSAEYYGFNSQKNPTGPKVVQGTGWT